MAVAELTVRFHWLIGLGDEVLCRRPAVVPTSLWRQAGVCTVGAPCDRRKLAVSHGLSLRSLKNQETIKTVSRQKNTKFVEIVRWNIKFETLFAILVDMNGRH